MLTFIEVIGVSKESFSEAVKYAIKKLTENGEKIHFFEIVQQRGSVRDNVIEFQVVLKVAIE